MAHLPDYGWIGEDETGVWMTRHPDPSTRRARRRAHALPRWRARVDVIGRRASIGLDDHWAPRLEVRPRAGVRRAHGDPSASSRDAKGSYPRLQTSMEKSLTEAIKPSDQQKVVSAKTVRDRRAGSIGAQWRHSGFRARPRSSARRLAEQPENDGLQGRDRSNNPQSRRTGMRFSAPESSSPETMTKFLSRPTHKNGSTRSREASPARWPDSSSAILGARNVVERHVWRWCSTRESIVDARRRAPHARSAAIDRSKRHETGSRSRTSNRRSRI